jgi:hypothetical protein
LEVAGLAWWGLGLVLIIRRGMLEPGAPDGSQGPRPERVQTHHRVAEVLDWFPETEPVFLERGFTAIRQPLLRRTVARQITLAQAASLRGASLDELLAALNGAIAERRPAPSPIPSDLPIIQIGVVP